MADQYPNGIKSVDSDKENTEDIEKDLEDFNNAEMDDSFYENNAD